MTEPTRKLYLVCGPESAGNRLMARILIEAGCYGDGDVIQKLDKKDPPPDVDKIVLHRSFPYGHRNENRHWPNIDEIATRFSNLGYHTTMVIMARDPFCMVKSQIKAQHVEGRVGSVFNIRVAYLKIFTYASNYPYILIPYESLVLHPKETIKWILEDLGLPQVEFSEEIRNENLKWYAQ